MKTAACGGHAQHALLLPHHTLATRKLTVPEPRGQRHQQMSMISAALVFDSRKPISAPLLWHLRRPVSTMFPSGRDFMLWAATWPYHWTFRNYTLTPLTNVASFVVDRVELERLLKTFITGKRHELYFVNVAVGPTLEIVDRTMIHRLTDLATEHPLRRRDGGRLFLAVGRQYNLACASILELQSYLGCLCSHPLSATHSAA